MMDNIDEKTARATAAKLEEMAKAIQKRADELNPQVSAIIRDTDELHRLYDELYDDISESTEIDDPEEKLVDYIFDRKYAVMPSMTWIPSYD